MSNRAAKGGLPSCPERIDMYPLPVAGRIGKHVNLGLGDLDPMAAIDILTYQFAQIFDSFDAYQLRMNIDKARYHNLLTSVNFLLSVT